jgi:dolichol-phosphate mannosyltransferase
MKRALLTGGSGFVGANLARRLLRDGHEVHLLLRPDYAPWRLEEIREDLTIHFADLPDEPAVKAAVAAIRPDWIFHLAAYGAYSSQTGIHHMAQTNLIGTINLLDACVAHGFAAFVNTGSSSEYGFTSHAATEADRLEPNSHYALTKAAATHYCRLTAQSRGLRIPTLRLYSVYGPFEEPSRLLPALIVRGLRGELPPLVDPDVARDYVYVDDVCDAFILAATQPQPDPGAVYNVGTGVQTPLRDLVALARTVLSIAAAPEWGSMPNRQWDTSVWVADIRKIRAELGWEPRHDLAHGFRRMVEWFQDNPALLALYRTRQAGAA